jgi:hypothetical protein
MDSQTRNAILVGWSELVESWKKLDELVALENAQKALEQIERMRPAELQQFALAAVLTEQLRRSGRKLEP